MSVEFGGGRLSGVADWLRLLVRGREDSRVRATYRVLLAMPVFWILAGGVIAGNLRGTIDAIPSGDAPLAGLAGSVLHAGVVLVLLVGWAHYFDRRPLSSYGATASRAWLEKLVVGLAAVGVAFGLWFAVASALGWASVSVVLSAPRGSLLVGAALFTVTLALHVWVQQLVFFRIIIRNAAEGLSSRGVSPRRAVFAGILVAVPIFIAMHQLALTLRMVDLAVVGLIYGLAYVHTGDLAAGIGLHLGIFFADQVLFVAGSSAVETLAVFQVTQSLPAPLAVLGIYGFPKMIIAYCLVSMYLLWRHDGIPVETGIARWSGQ
jgi:hypothetical protein